VYSLPPHKSKKTNYSLIIFDLLDLLFLSSIGFVAAARSFVPAHTFVSPHLTRFYLRGFQMRIDIHSSKFALTESLRSHIERRVQFALSWAYHKLPHIHLRLDDVNGPKGGVDKVCRIQIPVVGGKPVVIEEIQTDMYIHRSCN
jgi:ribosome-associated translation inhibitor RaiA